MYIPCAKMATESTSPSSANLRDPEYGTFPMGAFGLVWDIDAPRQGGSALNTML